MSGSAAGPGRRSAAQRRADRVEWKKGLDRWLGIPLHLLARGLQALAALVRRPAAVGEVHHVVLCKLWGVGNLAMILPYLRALHRKHPDASLTFVTLERNRPLLEDHPLVDQVLTVHEAGIWRLPRSILGVVRALRRRPPDLFLDFEQFLRVSGLLAWAGRARQRVGFRTPGQYRSLLYHARVPYRSDRHMAQVFGDVVRAVGVPVEGLPPLEVPRTPALAQAVRRWWRQGRPRPWILIHPGSGDTFPGRRWPRERFAAASARLREAWGGTLLLSGTAEEGSCTRGVMQLLPPAHRPAAEDLAGRLTLRELVELIGAVDLVLSNDTGPVHLAAATGTPLVALYGPNTPRLYGPLHAASRALDHRLPCSPCLTNTNAKSSACRHPACILAIEVDEVVHAAQALLVDAHQPLSRGAP